MGNSANLSMRGGLQSTRSVAIFGANSDLLLNEFPGAAAAYSLDKLDKNYNGSAIRVRRSSDNQEQDIGFVDNVFDSASLESFVDIDADVFISDFPNGVNPSSGNATLVSNQTVQAPSSIDGYNDALKFTCSSETATRYDFRLSGMDTGELISVSFQYYIPSENTIVESIRFTDLVNLNSTHFNTKGEWTSVTITNKEIDNNILRFFAADSSGGTNIGLEVTEAFYIRNLEVTQSTASAFVTTWYDQTANYNATQTTASNQPKITVQGTYLGYIENLTNTNNQLLSSSYPYVAAQRFTSFIVGQQFGNAVFGGTQSTSPFYGTAQDGSNNTNYSGFSSDISYFGNGVSIGDERQDISSVMINMSLLTTLARKGSGGDSLLAMGYVDDSYNNVRLKEYIIYDNQSVDREGVETYIMTHYNL